MANYNYGGGDEENPELKKLNAEVVDDPDSFEAWEKLVRTAEGLEGGLNRNSSAQSISAAREIYDRFLARFPLFFGYWKKYADLEFAIAGTEAAELVYERGVASITNSVDLWAQYCAFKVETSHDPDFIRELFERGAENVGLDFLAHPFWDKYIEFEERLEQVDRIFAILGRIIHIPMHQYARYFERFRQLAQSRNITELCPAETAGTFRAEIEAESAGNAKTNVDVEQELRTRIDNYHLEIFHLCQTETTKRWTYEQEVKRPYFHVTELDDAQLVNWRKYLDFEEGEGDSKRTSFLYERCLVAAAYYDEFWLRYARWMSGQSGKTQEVRHIYQRAACIYVPVSRPEIRLQYALFEEMSNRVDVAHAIYEAILVAMPGHVETITAWANSARRNEGLSAAIEVYNTQLGSDTCDAKTKAALVAEHARLLWKVKGSSTEAREVFSTHQADYLDSTIFWTQYLNFEIEQPSNPKDQSTQLARVKQVYEDIGHQGKLQKDAVKELAHSYMVFLLEQGTKDVAKEFLSIDREVNGPPSIQTTNTNGVKKAAATSLGDSLMGGT